MFCEIINILNVDSDLKCEIDPNEKKYSIRRISTEIMQEIITNYTKQINTTEYNRVCYNYDDKSKIFHQQDNDDFMVSNLNHITVEYFDELVICEIMCINNLVEYLHLNCDCSYIAIPVYHKYHNAGVCHISTLIFDNNNKLSYHIDSNKIDKGYKINTIEKIFEYHIGQMCDFGLKYNFIKSKNWNSGLINLNKNFKSQELNDNGNCVLWTILLIKLLQDTHKTPSDLFNQINQMATEEKIFILKYFGDSIYKKYNLHMYKKYIT
jgi:hypothetical protein